MNVSGARGRGRPPRLGREQILDAVAALPNVDSLTMRDLATQLGVRHGALYRWVKNRDELFDLIGAAVIDRVVARADPGVYDWRARLSVLVRAFHDELLAIPGYATHLSRPHHHDAHSTDRLRSTVVQIFSDAGVPVRLAEHSWYILVTATVSWTAFEEQAHHLDDDPPGFDTFLDVLLRGLPARDEHA